MQGHHDASETLKWVAFVVIQIVIGGSYKVLCRICGFVLKARKWDGNEEVAIKSSVGSSEVSLLHDLFLLSVVCHEIRRKTQQLSCRSAAPTFTIRTFRFDCH